MDNIDLINEDDKKKDNNNLDNANENDNNSNISEININSIDELCSNYELYRLSILDRLLMNNN